MAFDLSYRYYALLEITACGDPRYFSGKYIHSMPIEIEAKCQSIEVVFKTAKNRARHYGFLLKYYSYENPKTLIASNESVDTKDMYVEYVILITALQSSLHKDCIIFCISKKY